MRLKTITAWAVVAVLAALPAMASAEMFGLGGLEPSPTATAPAANSGPTFGLGTERAETICYTWPDGTVECFESVAAFEAATGIPFYNTVSAPLPKLTPIPLVEPVAETFGMAAYRSPAGYHRHVMNDGSIIEHHDSNYGSASAHRGVAGAGWPKYYGPAAPSDVVTRTVQRSVSRQQLVRVPCPTCPSGYRYVMQTVTTPASVAQKSNSVSYSRTVERAGGWYPGRLLQRTRAAVRSRVLWRPFARSRSFTRSVGGG